MGYNPELLEEEEPEIDLNQLQDEEREQTLVQILEAVGEEGLTDEDLDFLEERRGPDRQNAEFNANLAEHLSQSVLDKIGQEVVERFDDDHQARMDWYAREVAGMRLLGVSDETDGGADFPGASKAVHPLFAEACVQFQARTIGEVWPADGPVKVIVVGESTPESEEQAQRVAEYLNYNMNNVIPGAYEAEDMAMMRLPMSGSVFKKVSKDPLYGQMDEFIPPDEFVVPYNAADLRTAQRYTHVKLEYPNEVRKYQKEGWYLDTVLPEPDERNLERPFYLEVKDAEGTTVWEREEDNRHTNLEQHTYWDIPGFEDKDEAGEPTGIELPYVIVVDYDAQKVLSIRRNWRENDPMQRKREWFVHKKFTPGFGFYGFGFNHWIGSLFKSSTGALRALLDAAQFANLPGGYRSKTGKALSGEGQVAPGEWRETDIPPEDLQSAFFPLPYGEPSTALFNLLGSMVDAVHRFASTTDVMVGEGSADVAVGTTLARIEQGEKTFSAIHKRLHRANREEYKLLAEQLAESMPAEGYPYPVSSGEQSIARADFDDRIDVLPVSDPEVVSTTQRIIHGQLLIEMSERAPDLYNRRATHKRALEAARTPNISEVLPEPKEAVRLNPVEENMGVMTGKPIQAFPDQDHMAHLAVHQAFAGGIGEDDKSRVMPALMAHMAEHKAWAYYAQMTGMMGAPLPASVMEEEPKEMDPETETRLSQMIAQAVQGLQEPPTPEQMQAQAEQASSQAEIARKDAVAQAEIARRDMLAQAEIEREMLETDADIERKSRVAEYDEARGAVKLQGDVDKVVLNEMRTEEKE